MAQGPSDSRSSPRPQTYPSRGHDSYKGTAPARAATPHSSGFASRLSTGAAERYVSLYEAKMIHQFDHRWATYDAGREASRDVTLAEKADPNFEPAPRYWVPESEVVGRLAAKNWTRGWLMGWRDIARAFLSLSHPGVAAEIASETTGLSDPGVKTFRVFFPTSPNCMRRSRGSISSASVCRARRCKTFADRRRGCRARLRLSASRFSGSARTSSESRYLLIGTTGAR